ncbi:hypothetical protein HN385_00745 [archaeon]|jgi:hypothetical protein|nr:hypothetical protein [archaeon]MBT3450923.1 hypothetical protein [archaeon]MBT6869569.1 hypothetical protein [archaeon]MBT7193439.1 hypothetical protein [archaeon]MBT7381030.1 hypothetical protein [archaeon]
MRYVTQVGNEFYAFSSKEGPTQVYLMSLSENGRGINFINIGNDQARILRPSLDNLVKTGNYFEGERLALSDYGNLLRINKNIEPIEVGCK